MRQFALNAALVSCLAAGAGAAIVQVDIFGTIEYNQIRNGPLNRVDVPAGSPVVIHFLLDSNLYMNDPDGLPTRGYFIDQASFTATYGSVTLGMENPFPAGQTPMFVLRDNDPAVDGFFLSNGTAYPFPIPTTEPGAFGQFGVNYMTSYDGNMLSSLDILGALGTWNYTGLSNLSFYTDDGGFEAMGLAFDQMTITAVPAPSALALVAPLGLVALRRRR